MRIYKLLVILLLALITASCQSISQKDINMKEFTGTIIAKRIFQDKNQVLVVEKIQREELFDKTNDEIIEIAREKNGVYFSIEKDEYEKVEIEEIVTVYYDTDLGQEDSEPPQRYSNRIKINSNMLESN